MRIGCVKYLNARPLIRGWPGQVAFDHPAALSDQLQRGSLQIALVSSFEFLRNPIYRIVDGVSISSDGPVYSVVVAHRGEISGIEEIELDPASLTSVALLRCLLGEIQLRPRLVIKSVFEVSDQRRATLLIGDQAIRFREKHAKEFEFWDLGEQWKKLFDLPFVYALWLVRPELAEAKAIGNQLRAIARSEYAANRRADRRRAEFRSGILLPLFSPTLTIQLRRKREERITSFRCVMREAWSHSKTRAGAKSYLGCIEPRASRRGAFQSAHHDFGGLETAAP